MRAENFLDGVAQTGAPSAEEFLGPPESSSMLRRGIADPAISLLKGAIAVPEAAVGLANIPTMGLAGKAAEGIGFRPKDARASIDTWYSPEQQAANKRVQDASGFFPTIQAAVENPSVIGHTVAESVPSMMGGAAIARGLLGAGGGALARSVGATAAPTIAGAAGEGIVGTGLASEQIRQQTPTGTLTPEQLGYIGASGIGTALIGAAGGAAARKMGLSDVDTMLAGGVRTAGTRGTPVRVLGGSVSEGVLEEMPQSAQEQAWQNLALNKPVAEGVPEQAAMGLLSGAVMGGAGGIVPQRQAAQQPPGPLQKAADAAATTPSTIPQEEGVPPATIQAGTIPQTQQPAAGIAAAVQNTPAAPGTPFVPVSTAAPPPTTTQAESAGVPVSQPQEGTAPRGNEAEITQPAEPGQQAQSAQAADSAAAEQEWQDFVATEGRDIGPRQLAVILGQFMARRRQASGIEAATGRVQDARQREVAANRMAVLESLPLTTTGNTIRRFAAALRNAGIRDYRVSPEERQMISRRIAARDTLQPIEQEPENELTLPEKREAKAIAPTVPRMDALRRKMATPGARIVGNRLLDRHGKRLDTLSSDEVQELAPKKQQAPKKTVAADELDAFIKEEAANLGKRRSMLLSLQAIRKQKQSEDDRADLDALIEAERADLIERRARLQDAHAAAREKKPFVVPPLRTPEQPTTGGRPIEQQATALPLGEFGRRKEMSFGNVVDTFPNSGSEEPKPAISKQDTEYIIRARIKKHARNMGVLVIETNSGWHTRFGEVSIPAEDAEAEGAISANHVFAHELGHAAMQKRGLSFKGFPIAETRKWIKNWDELVRASKEYRPGVWNHANKKIRDHARKPEEVIADAIASVIIGSHPPSLLRDIPGLNERDIGFDDKPKPANPAAVSDEDKGKQPNEPAVQDVNMQNRDRSRAASVVQMSDIARNPDYMRLGPSRTPDSGAPMVFAAGDDQSRIPAANFGRADVSVMSDGQRVPFRYAVVDASQVEPSNFADGLVNPAFSADRAGTIKALNNGRVAGLRAAYEIGSAGAYQAELASDLANVGISPDAMRATPNPILVRVYSDTANTSGMAAKSQAQGLGMSPAELARQDAPLLDSSVLDVLRPGDIAAADNRDFVRAFVGKLRQSGQDIAGMMTDSGSLSSMGRQRINAALMQAAYGNSDLVTELFDSIDTDIKAIGDALKSVAGAWANMRDSAKLGSIAPEADITEPIVSAVRLIQKARRERLSLYDLVNQRDIETGEAVDDLTAGALRLFYTGQNMTRPTGKERLVANLERYLELAMATSSGADMFGDKANASQLIQAITKDDTDAGNKVKAEPSSVPAAGPGPGRGRHEAQGQRGAASGNQPAKSGGQGKGGQEAVIVPPVAIHAPAVTSEAAGRGSFGASLTKEQRKSVLRTLVDVYKANRAPRESKGLNRNGDEVFGYAYSPEYFVKSDITGKMVRYYVTLPDGRIAHPTELFPDYTQSNIDGELLRQKEEDKQAKYAIEFRKRLIESRKADDVQSANRIFWKQNIGGNIDPSDTILYTNGKQFVRGLKSSKDNDLPVLGEGWTVVPVPTFEESKAFDLAAQTPEEIAAAEAAAKAAEAKAEKEKKAADDAQKKAELTAEVKKRSEAAAETFELGGNAMSNLTGQGDMFSAPPDAAAPSREPTSKAGELPKPAANLTGESKSATQIIKEVAKARPFDDPKAVREDARKAVKEQTGKDTDQHSELRGMLMTDPVYQAIHDGQYEGIRAYAATLPVHISESAIPMEIANRAFSGTSMSPERRGENARRNFLRALVGLWRRFEKSYNAAQEDRQSAFVSAFNDIASRYAGLTIAYLSSHSRVMSSMIAGPSGFPVARQRKLSAASDNKAKEANEYLSKAPAKLLRALRGALDNSVSAALAEAESKLAERKADQARMKSVNVAHARFMKSPESLDKADLTDGEKKLIREYKPAYSWEPHPFAPFELTNNGSEIRRLTARVEELKRRLSDAEAAMPEEEAQQDENGPVRIVRNAAAGRLQLFFKSKPDEAVRADLKASGFRWSPSESAWQRQLTDNAVTAAEQIVAKHFPKDVDGGNVGNVSRSDFIPMSPSERPAVGPPAAEGNSVIETQEGRDIILRQERAVYNVNEPDDISGDLFRGTTPDLFAGTEHALSAAARKNLSREGSPAARAARSAPRPAARVLAVRQAPDTPGLYRVSAQLVSVGERELPVARIRSFDDAAKAFAYLPRFAVEHYDAIVTDKVGKPLAIIGGFKGAIGEVAVPPSTLIAELSRIDGASTLWTAHNHPSGMAVLSNADRRIDEIFRNALDGTGIEYRGLFAMTGAGSRSGVVKYDHTEVGSGEVQAAKLSSLMVPIVERELIDERDSSDKIDSPRAARSLIPQVAGETTGMVLLDSQRGISAFIPFRGPEMGMLRANGRLMQLFRAASKANARSAVVADPGGSLSDAQINNLHTALQNIDVNLLDVISYDPENVVATAKSRSESGGAKPIANPGGVVFSFAGQQSATSDQFQIDLAKQLLADGANANAVRQQTGWFKGVDGKWRYEIDDSGASLKAHGFGFGELLGTLGKNLKLGDVLDHPALFAAYPSIADSSVEAIDEKSQNNGRLVTNKDGSFTILVNAGLGETKALSVMLHEIQHGIQSVEGFASGGNIDQFVAPILRKKADLEKRIFEINKLLARSKGDEYVELLADRTAIVDEILRLPDDIGALEQGYKQYRKLAGEVESRSVQQRQNFTADRRKYSDPLSTQDVAPEDVIVMFNGKDAANAPQPANTTRSSAMAAIGASPADRAVYEMVSEGRSADEILSFISKASRRPFNRVLAAALRKAGLVSTVTLDSAKSFGKQQGAQRYAAAYNASTDTVALFAPREAERHVLHEFVHAATMKAIKANGLEAVRLRALFKRVQQSGMAAGQYGMSVNKDGTPNLDEFVAELFSNPKFQDALKGIPAPSGSTLKNAWEWFVRIVARIVGIKTRAAETALDRALVLGAQLMQENVELAGRGGIGDTRYAVAWHGTPHVWPPEPGFPHGRPRLDKIGTGEGAQAYGWGWYSAGARDVAKLYQEQLSSAIPRKLEGITPSNDIERMAINRVNDLLRYGNKTPDEAIKETIVAARNLRGMNDPSFLKRENQIASYLEKLWDTKPLAPKHEGSIYQLDIPDDVMPKLLDWDKPLIEQSQDVQASLRRLYNDLGWRWHDSQTGSVIYETLSGDMLGARNHGLYGDEGSKAGAAYDSVGRKANHMQAASEYLAKVGIPGLRYLDGRSRNANTYDQLDKASFNFVIWDQKVLDRIALLERNGEKLDAIRAADAVRFSIADSQPFDGRETATTPLKPGTTTLMVDGIERPALNSNGKPIHWSEEGVRNFWRWFGSSRVVDAQGRPLVVYHGTKGNFNSFDLSSSAANGGYIGKGVYVTNNELEALDFGANVMDLYMDVKTPFVEGVSKVSPAMAEKFIDVVDGPENWKRQRAAQMVQSRNIPSVSMTPEDITAIISAGGYDGAKDGPHWVAYSNTQIKSATGNTGAFSSEDPDIRYNIATDWQQSPIAQEVAKAFKAAARSDAALSWLNPVQTQYHKAETLAKQGKPLFKRVFDLGQKFLSDISRFAVMAENAAPTLFHQIRSAADIKQAIGAALHGDFGKQHNADIRAIAAPLYEGTLYGGGNPMAGIVWADEQLRDRFGLTDSQINLYHEAREAVRVSMDEMAKSLIAKHAKRERVMVDTTGMLQDVADTVSQSLVLRADVLADEAQEEYDDAMQEVQDLRDIAKESKLRAKEAEANAKDDAKSADVKAMRSRTRSDTNDKLANEKEKEAKAKIEAQKAEVARIKATAEDVQAIADKAQKLQDAGYFPLMRFGRHTVTAWDENGKVQHFSMHDGIPLVPRSGQAQANLLADALREENPDWTVTTGLMNPEKYKLYQGMSVDALQLFSDHLDSETKQTYQEILRLATNERSALKRMLKREGTPGFDKDVRRTLASFILSNARYTSSAYNLADMAKAAEDAENDGGDIGAEAVKLYEYVAKPQEEAAKIRGFLFFNFLGGSLAAAMVNATQVPMMTFPRLAQYEQAGKLAARLGQAAKLAIRNPAGIQGDIGEALRRAEENGITAPHQIYEMTATAANNVFTGSRAGSALLRAWGAPFALAESFNRRTTFIAAYQIGRQMTENQLRDAGAASAFEFAEKIVQETQGIYNRGNRVNLGRGAIGATVMTFKQFSIMYLEMLSRLPPKQQAIMVGMLILAAGAGGLPFAEDVEDIIDTIGQWLGYRTNTRRAIRRGLTDLAGQQTADIAMNGVLSQMGVDLHSRLGLQNIIPGSAIMKPSTTDKSREFQDLLGPAASVVASLGQALQDLATGRPLKAAEALAPVAVQNAVKGARMAATGRAEDMRGKPTIPVSAAEAAAKGIGFNPKAVADYGTAKRDIMQDERLLDVTRERFTAAIVDAIIAGDDEARREALQQVVEWNRRNPDARININPASIRRRVADMRAEGPARVLKSLSPSLRQQAQQELADAR